MKIRNNILDELQHERNKYTYAMNIGLKSGEIIFLDGICLGEKNAYINFTKYSKDTMILEIDNSLYKINASDIESLNVTKYKTESSKVSNFFNYLFFSKGNFDKTAYLFVIKWFIFAAVLSIMFAGFKTIFAGDMMTNLMKKSTMDNVVKLSFVYMKKAFWGFLLLQILMFIIDLILPPKEAHKRLKPYSGYAEPTRMGNLVIILIYILSFQVFYILLLKMLKL